MRRLAIFVFGSYVVGALLVVGAIAASSYLLVHNRDNLLSRLPVQGAMLDIIRCQPPTHPDPWLQQTSLGIRSGANGLRAGSLLHRADIFDPSDCGRTITQALNARLRPANQPRIG
jgi:hypothetical protein